jgi:hypothetical protein
VDYVIKSGVKLDHWCRDELYYTYLSEMIKSEPADAAIQRSLNTMMEWGDEQNANFAHYFDYVNINRAVRQIADGMISPWLILNCDTGKKLLSKFNDEQLGIVFQVLDPDYWSRRFKIYPADLELVKNVVEEGNL